MRKDVLTKGAVEEARKLFDGSSAAVVGALCDSHEGLRDVLRRVLEASAWDDPGTGTKMNIAEWLEDEALRKEAEAAVKG